jgi:hypothetical protein
VWAQAADRALPNLHFPVPAVSVEIRPSEKFRAGRE